MHVGIDPCQFCEAIFDALRKRAKEECGPYDDKEYWMRREMERIAQKLVEESPQ